MKSEADMASIATYSPEKVYTIKVVSKRTGVKTVTLRAWERRYDLLTPLRLENGYRLYSEQDIQVLLWVVEKLNGGEPVSRVSEQFKTLRAQDKWPDAVSMPEVEKPRLVSPIPPRDFAEMMYGALITHQEGKAGMIMDDVEKYFDVKTIFEEVLFPALVLLGEAWYRGDIRIATEHFSSNFVRGRLLRIFQAIPVKRENVSVLVGCGPEEAHEIASLMFSILLRQEGYGVEYLGPDLPIQDLVDYASTVRPKMICLSVSSEDSANYVKDLAANLGNLPGRPRLAYGGRYFNENIAARTGFGGAYLGGSLSDGIKKIKELLPIG